MQSDYCIPKLILSCLLHNSPKTLPNLRGSEGINSYLQSGCMCIYSCWIYQPGIWLWHQPQFFRQFIPPIGEKVRNARWNMLSLISLAAVTFATATQFNTEAMGFRKKKLPTWDSRNLQIKWWFLRNMKKAKNNFYVLVIWLVYST